MVSIASTARRHWVTGGEDKIVESHAAAVATPQPVVTPLEETASLKERTYRALRQAVCATNPYSSLDAPRLDERRLAEDLGISRTPVREALARLEQEGLVHTIPRRGVYLSRKTKAELIEMITVWAALESMAARLVIQNAEDGEIAGLRRMFATFVDGQAAAKIDEYSETNIAFHQQILKLSRCRLLCETAEGLFIHMRWIRGRTIGEDDRTARSIIDHMNIIEALEKRDTETAEHLVRQHSLDLATHVDRSLRDPH